MADENKPIKSGSTAWMTVVVALSVSLRISLEKYYEIWRLVQKGAGVVDHFFGDGALGALASIYWFSVFPLWVAALVLGGPFRKQHWWLRWGAALGLVVITLVAHRRLFQMYYWEWAKIVGG